MIGFCAALVGSSAFPSAAQAQDVYGAFMGPAAEDIRQDDLPDHTRPTAGRLLRICAFWLALWFVPVGVLVAALGLDNVFSQIAILFSKMAALSLGGPYAVNSYVALHAVGSRATRRWTVLRSPSWRRGLSSCSSSSSASWRHIAIPACCHRSRQGPWAGSSAYGSFPSRRSCGFLLLARSSKDFATTRSSTRR